jgi:hypothetical protein
LRWKIYGHRCQFAAAGFRPRGQRWQQALIQRRDAVVVKARCLRAIDRHLFRFFAPQFAVALVLLGDVAQASCAPLRSNLLIATKSAKSSMSIFPAGSCAEFRVITYIDTSTCGTIAASP